MDNGVVVISVRTGRDRVVLRTDQGDVVIECTPTTKHRSRVVIRAPRSIRVDREKMEAQHDAV